MALFIQYFQWTQCKLCASLCTKIKWPWLIHLFQLVFAFLQHVIQCFCFALWNQCKWAVMTVENIVPHEMPLNSFVKLCSLQWSSCEKLANRKKGTISNKKSFQKNVKFQIYKNKAEIINTIFFALHGFFNFHNKKEWKFLTFFKCTTFAIDFL